MEKLELIKRALEKGNQAGAFTLAEARTIEDTYERLVKEFQALAQLVQQNEKEKTAREENSDKEDTRVLKERPKAQVKVK